MVSGPPDREAGRGARPGYWHPRECQEDLKAPGDGLSLSVNPPVYLLLISSDPHAGHRGLFAMERKVLPQPSHRYFPQVTSSRVRFMGPLPPHMDHHLRRISGNLV